ncbi:MAG TPA: hypothetical protein DFI01_03785, partial [Bacteroidales bacterium]|nr:hypothetical protein [Bacteroidales bacterium]
MIFYIIESIIIISIFSGKRNKINMKARKFLLLFSISFLTILNSLAQPVWTSGPTITPQPISVKLDFSINRPSYVYYFVIPGNYACQVAAQVKWLATRTLPYGSVVSNDVITYTSGSYSTQIYGELANFSPNTQYTIEVVAEDQAVPGSFSTVFCQTFSTLPCPKVQLFTYFGNQGECVNTGANGVFQAAHLGAFPTGVLKGTTWNIDWGDGTTWSYTSTADDDIPPLQTHTFTNVSECVYEGTWIVKNPCNEFLSGRNVFVVHGRDIPDDGDGVLQIVDDATGTPNILYLCEGQQYNVTLRDNSTWNCQSPGVPPPLNPADYDNDQPRTLQWVYGETPSGTVMNTITGNVIVGGTHVTNLSNGYEGPVNPGQTSVGLLSEVITIPATSVVGQRYYVYLKNWNKCNPYEGNPALNYEYTQFIIEIIDAPDAPTVTSPQIYCFDTYPTSVSATPNTVGNTINWYSDAAKTTLLGTGLSYTHGKSTPGIYYFYPAETSVSNSCEGPTAQIVFTIREELTRPGSITGPTGMCTGATGLVYSVAANPPKMPIGGETEYVWTVPSGWTINSGQGTKQITATAGTTTGSQTVSVILRYKTTPTCQSPSQELYVTLYAQPVAPVLTKSPNETTVCAGATLTVKATSGSGGTGTVTDQYRYSTDGGTSWSAWSTSIPSFTSEIGTNLVQSRRTATGPGCNTSPVNEVSWNVVADPVAPVIAKDPSDASVCVGATLTITVTTAGSGGAGTTIQDQYRYSTNGGSSWTGWSTTTPSFSAVKGTNLVQSRRYASASGCESDINEVSWTVVDDPVAPALTKVPTDGTVCAGATLTATVTTPGSGGLGTCQDEYRYNDGTWHSWGITMPSFSAITGTNYIQSRRTSTGAGCASTTPSISWAVVNDPVAPVIAKSPGDAIVCAGATLTITVTTSGSGGTGTRRDEYQYSTDGGTSWSGWSATIPAFSAVAGINIVQSRRYASGSGCESDIKEVSWTVVPDPVAPAIVKNPTDAVVCAGATLNITISTPGSGGTGTTIRDEYRYSTDGGINWSSWSTSHPDVTAVVGTNLYQSRRYASGSGCESDIKEVSWTVVADPVAPVIAKNPGVAEVCAGITLTITITTPGSGGTGTTRDEYQYSTDGGTSWSGWSTTIPGFSAVTGSNKIQSRRYASGPGCESDIKEVSWNVVPQPVAPVIQKQPDVAAVCEGTALTVTVTTPGSGGSGTVQDEYRYSTDNGVNWSSWGTSLPGFSAVPGTNIVQSRRTATGYGCNTSPSNSVFWTVNPNPTPVISGTNNVCQNDDIVYSTPLVAGHSYSWSTDIGTIIGPSNNNSVTIRWTTVGNGTVTVTETIIVTGCFKTTSPYPVTVNPGPPTIAPTVVSAPSDVCLNGTLNIDVTDVPSAAQYIWDYSWVPGTNNATTATSQANISLTGLSKGTYTVSVAGSNGCGIGPWMPVHTFDINDLPDLSPLSSNPCSDVATGITLSITNLDANYCSGITYTITSINNGGLTASAGSPSIGSGFPANVIADDAWTNTTGADVNVIYTIIPVSTQGCSGTPENVTVTVKSEPKGVNDTKSICSDNAVNYNIQTQNINVLGNSQPSTFVWVAASNPNVGGESTTPQSGNVIN